MPKVKITTPFVDVELEANESSIDALGKQAIGLLAEAVAALPVRNTVGFGGQHAERRWTYDHHDTKYGGGGFGPVQARSEG